MPELWNPRPFQVVAATILNLTGPLPGPPPWLGEALCGSPGLLAGKTALRFRWTLPSGAVLRMSLLLLVALNVTVWTSTRYQITEPPTGTLVSFGPNSS